MVRMVREMGTYVDGRLVPREALSHLHRDAGEESVVGGA